MMSGRNLGGPIAVLGVIATTLACAPAQAQPRAVLELFTSQGCSSCPPADKLIGEFGKDPQVIALSLAIDYWDYLGWKDTLAIPGHGGRQRAYSRARNDRDVFTPQMVVNGSVQALGSDKAAIERAIVQSRRNASVLSVPVTIAFNDGKVTVNAASGKMTSERAEVWLCPVAKQVAVEIAKGENKGRTVTYHNVVRQWVKLGDWNGAAATWSIPLKDLKVGSVDHVAVVVQSGLASAPGPMYGAVMAQLPAQ